MKKVICYLAGSSGDWGGASRVLCTNLKLLDRNKYQPLVLLPFEGPMTHLLQERGIPYIIWGKDREPQGLARYAGAIAGTIRFYRKHKVNLVHINYASYWRPAEVLAAKLLRIPVITHYHIVRTQAGPFVHYSSAIAAVSRFTAEASKPDRVLKRVIYNAVEIERFDRTRNIRDELGLKLDDIIISFLGQVRELKGIDLFIQLANNIRDSRVHFLIAGACRDPAKFKGAYTEERLRREIGGNKNVHYVGYRSDVETIYGISDIIVMPSHWEEPFGLVTIEAGAARKPVIATRVGGIPEIIKHGENGFLVERGDLASLIYYARRLIENAELRRQMGSNARAVVEREFTHAPVRELEKLYDDLI